MLQELVLALWLILRLLVVLPRVHVVGLVEIIGLPLFQELFGSLPEDLVQVLLLFGE